MKKENDLQVQYIPASQYGSDTDTMIPRDLATATKFALDRVIEKHGDIDEFVASNLAWTKDEMGDYLSRDQVDAVALGIDKYLEGRGLIVGDQTGLGKGRIAGSFMRFAFLNGYTPVFLTATPDLFSDIYRDLRSVNSENLFNPFILNDGAPIRNMDGTIAVKATNKAEIKAALEKENLPIGYNAVLATYSQFNRQLSASPKGSFLREIATDNIIITDEAHKAAGDSNTSMNVIRAVSRAAGIIYSSATFSKGANTMTLYAKAFPQGYSVGAVSEVMRRGGEPVMEIISSTLAKDGAMIRREHDADSLEVSTIYDEENLEKWEKISDQFAIILQDLASLEKGVTVNAKDEFQDHKRRLTHMGQDVSKLRMEKGMNFGSRVYNLIRQFATMSKADFTARMALRDLENGLKPAIMLEQTLESAINTALDLGQNPGELSFKDILRNTAYRISHQKEIDKVTGLTSYKLVNMEGIEEKLAHIHDKIDKFPILPLSPIDTVRETLEEAGYTVGELSGRKLMLVRDPLTGEQSVEKRKKENTTKEVHKFNSGDYDAVIFTKAACAGLSMHADASFEDQRRRVLYELEVFADVLDRKQGWGRFQRKGETSSPLIKGVSNGLPAEHRVLAMQERKIKNMQSTTTSNSESNMHIDGVIDILNSIGDEICEQYFSENPDLVEFFEEMGINLYGMQSYPPNHFVNKLTGYMCLMSVSEQRAIYDDLSQLYNQKIAELDAEGVNPLKTKRLDIKARTISKVLVAGTDQEHSDSVFDEPMYMSEIEYDEEVRPLPLPIIENIIEKNRANLVEVSMMGAAPVPAFLKELKDTSQAKLEALTNEKYPTIGDAIYSPQPNHIKSLHGKLNYAEYILHNLTSSDARVIGQTVNYFDNDEFGNRSNEGYGVIVNFKMPDINSAHCLGEYVLTILPENGEKPFQKTFFQLYSGKFQTYSTNRIENEKVWLHLKENRPGTITRRISTLTGNNYMAAELAVLSGIGRCVSYTNDQGESIRGVVLKDGAELAISEKALPVKLNHPSEAFDLLDTDHAAGGCKSLTVGVASRSATEMGKAFNEIYYNAQTKFLEMSVKRARTDRYLFQDPVLEQYITSIKKKGSSTYGNGKTYVSFDPTKRDEVIERLMEITVVMAPAASRDLVETLRRNRQHSNLKKIA